jgi:hypothetical protein
VPHLLRPFLPRLWLLNPNAGSYTEHWIWRGAGPPEIAELAKTMKDSEMPIEDRQNAWHGLINTRNLDAVSLAVSFFEPLSIAAERSAAMRPLSLNDFIHLVGFHHEENKTQRLHGDTTYHVRFPEGFFEESTRPEWLSRYNHPTWDLVGEQTLPAELGGELESSCCLCGGSLHRLVRFESAPDGLPIAPGSGLDLATCLSCLGWEEEVLFYKHDEQGRPSCAGPSGPHREPEFPSGPLRPGLVGLANTPPRWSFQDWGASNGRENLNRVGGSPSWIQDADYPTCPECQSVMPFLAQFDSDLPMETGGEWMWGSGGICYVHWCSACSISAAFWQCT